MKFSGYSVVSTLIITFALGYFFYFANSDENKFYLILISGILIIVGVLVSILGAIVALVKKKSS